MATTTLTDDDVIKMLSSLSNWGRWGKDDELGTINLIPPRSGDGPRRSCGTASP